MIRTALVSVLCAMAIVIPRALSSGALSIESKLRNSASPFSASVFVIAAVNVVFP